MNKSQIINEENVAFKTEIVNLCCHIKCPVMERKELIENTLFHIKQLPDVKIMEIHDFAEFLLMKIEDRILQQGIQELASSSNAFSYLNEEEDLYSVNDLKERYK